MSRVALGFRCRRVRGWGAELEKKKGGGFAAWRSEGGARGIYPGREGKGGFAWRMEDVESTE